MRQGLKSTDKFKVAVLVITILLVPVHATAQMSEEDALTEAGRQLLDWKKQGRVEDIKIISNHDQALLIQIRAGKIDLQAIVDEHNYEHEDGKFYGENSLVEQSNSGQPFKVRKSVNVPDGNKPVATYSRLEESWQGIPAQLTYTAVMDLYFPNGNTVTCSNWDPAALDPTLKSVGRAIKSCEIKKGEPEGDKHGKFKKGETIDIAFGNVSALEGDIGEISSSQISKSDLRMTKDGRIIIGKFRRTSVRSNNNGVWISSRDRSINGSYDLDGHIITIKTDGGEILNGFIGAAFNKGSQKIDHIYVNGEHFWNRKK